MKILGIEVTVYYHRNHVGAMTLREAIKAECKDQAPSTPMVPYKQCTYKLDHGYCRCEKQLTRVWALVVHNDPSPEF